MSMFAEETWIGNSVTTRSKSVPPDLSVGLKREFSLSTVLKDAAIVLQALLDLKSTPRLKCTVPPGVKQKITDITGEFLGLGFPGVYVQLEDDPDVLAGIGVITTMTPNTSPLAYFSGGRSVEGKALVAALAIAVARLVGSPIEDSSGHWMPNEEFTPEELKAAISNLPRPK